MATDNVRAILVTAEHLLVCEVPTRGTRLLDSLLDERTAFVDVRKVQVCRRAATAEVVATLDRAAVAKELLGLAILGRAKHEAPGARLNARISKQVCPAFLIAAGCEIRGQLHYRGTCEPVPLLHSELLRFIPVTQATVNYDGGTPIPGAVVLANKAYTSLLQVGEPQAAGGPSGPAEEPTAVIGQPISVGNALRGLP